MFSSLEEVLKNICTARKKIFVEKYWKTWKCFHHSKKLFDLKMFLSMKKLFSLEIFEWYENVCITRRHIFLAPQKKSVLEQFFTFENLYTVEKYRNIFENVCTIRRRLEKYLHPLEEAFNKIKKSWKILFSRTFEKK